MTRDLKAFAREGDELAILFDDYIQQQSSREWKEDRHQPGHYRLSSEIRCSWSSPGSQASASQESRESTLRLRDSYSDEAGLLGTKHWLGLYNSLLTDT
jgi:hypothetical protein